jgi:hypothetical protein
VVHGFTGADGAAPSTGLTFTPNGNAFGATYFGGTDAGVLYELTPTASGYVEKVLYDFPYPSDAIGPSGLAYSHGLLFGATNSGGQYGAGTIFSLKP